MVPVLHWEMCIAITLSSKPFRAAHAGGGMDLLQGPFPVGEGDQALAAAAAWPWLAPHETWQAQGPK